MRLPSSGRKAAVCRAHFVKEEPWHRTQVASAGWACRVLQQCLLVSGSSRSERPCD